MAEPVTDPQRDALAAELALSLLEGEERAEAMRLRLSDPAFAAAVEAWLVRFEPLYDQFEEKAPPAIWPAIQRRLAMPADPKAQRALRLWRVGAIGSGAIAAGLAAVLLLRPAPAPVEIVRAPDRTVIAQLGSGEAPALLAATYDPSAGELRIRALRVPESKLAPELWVIPGDGVPRSLGLVKANGVTRLPVAIPHRKLLADGATLAITLEPRDGAPHQSPSSPAIAAGIISTI